MRRFWTATFLVLGTMTLGTLLALRSGPLVIHTAQWAVVTLTDYRLDLREPLLDVYAGTFAAKEIHLAPKAADTPALISVVGLSVTASPRELLHLLPPRTRVAARQLLIYVSENDETADPAPMQWLRYLVWLPEQLRIEQVHLITAAVNTWVFPLKNLHGDRLAKDHYRASTAADYDGEPLDVTVDLLAHRRERQLRGVELQALFRAPQSGSRVTLSGELTGTRDSFQYDFSLDANYRDIEEFFKAFKAAPNLAGSLLLEAKMTGNARGFRLTDAHFSLDNMPNYSFEADGTLTYRRDGSSELQLDALGQMNSLHYLVNWIDLDLKDLGSAQTSVVLSGSLQQPVVEQFRLHTNSAAGLQLTVSGSDVKLFDLATAGAADDNRIRVQLQGPSLSVLEPWLGKPRYETGPWRATGLLSGGRDDMRLSDLHVAAGTPGVLELHATGGIDQIGATAADGLAAIDGVHLNVTAHVPESTQLADITGIDIPPQHALDAQLQLRGSGRQLSIGEAEIRVGAEGLRAQFTPLTGILQLSPSVKLSELSGTVSAHLDDSAALSRYVDFKVPSLGALAVSATLAQDGEAFALQNLIASATRDRARIETRGRIGNLVQFSGVALTTRLAQMEVGELLSLWQPQARYPADLGLLHGSFHLTGRPHDWQLSKIQLHGGDDDSPLWFSIQGDVGNISDRARASLTSSFRIEDRQLLRALIGLPTQPLSGSLAVDSDSGSYQSTLQLRVGTSSAHVDGVIDYREGQLQGLNVNASIPRLHLQDLGFAAKEPAEKENAAPGRPDSIRQLIAKAPRYPLVLKLQVGEITGDNTAIDGAEIEINGVDKRYTLSQLTVRYDNTRADIRGIIDLNPSPPVMSLAGEALAVRLSALLQDLNIDSDIRGTLTARGGVLTQGTSADELLSTLDGSVAVALEDAVIKGAAYDVLATDLLAWIYSGAALQSHTDVDCTMAKFHLHKGVASSDSLYIETHNMVATGKAELDLVKQTIDLKVTPFSRSRKLQFPSSVRVKGDLHDPKATISPIAAAANASAEAIMLVPGLVTKLFGLGERDTDRTMQPCLAKLNG